ncbi:MAG: bifunctional 4-hydroxy-2-oxoglutarate aldolase/2-dehydro-3-deoxy-phosphogluconate aldolase [Victivallaceae bacterium]|nr:bifunctional 4-hydroxy-2-oxoglutarate aldolase/2-dehydro-3-deoxy-phosphogluconate aldolase [Victivallaceae bacterium]
MNEFMEANRSLAAELAKLKVVPVLVLESVEEGLKIGRILMDNGLPGAEVTFRTPAAADAIRAMSEAYPDMIVGAGTVLDEKSLGAAAAAGARFAVAPGFNPKVVAAARERGMAFAPGVATPSELEAAYEAGCQFLKFFPAEQLGGIKMLKSMAAPYLHLGIKFMPTGGVTRENAAEYLAFKAVAAVGGTWLAKAPDVALAVREAAKLQEA